ncbi:MAG: hypothetical protein H8E14_02730 [Candidatus Marinimicrobia bacterium]|nr:hypothetical protein [Candidatus Neomarinimicrobiota bacterium]
MFDYLWWLLPSFMKKSLIKNSNLRGIIRTVATSLSEVKTVILKSRLAKFFIPTDTTTDFYETDYPEYLLEHAKDKNLPQPGLNELTIDPQMRTFLGTKDGMKYYLEMMIPEIRVDFIYELTADETKWLIFSKSHQIREALFNRSVLLNKPDQINEDYEGKRKTRIYSKADQKMPEFSFWVKVYNPITEENSFTVYPEKILPIIDRLKPAHTRGYLVFNYIDPRIITPLDGQVFIGSSIDVSGTIRQIEQMGSA